MRIYLTAAYPHLVEQVETELDDAGVWRSRARLDAEVTRLQAKLDAVSDQLAGARQDRNSASARATRLADERDILRAKLDAVRYAAAVSLCDDCHKDIIAALDEEET
jgi:hypothetical protein